MKELGIMESYKSKSSSLCAAAEAAEQVPAYAQSRASMLVRCLVRCHSFPVGHDEGALESSAAVEGACWYIGCFFECGLSRR